MPRPDRPLDPTSGPVAAFAHELRMLRTKAGSPKYLQMSRKTGRSRTALSEAAGGDHLPTWETVEAFVIGCGGYPTEWVDRWERARDEIQLSKSDRPLPIADASPVSGDADTVDSFHAPETEPDEGSPAAQDTSGPRLRRSRLWIVGLIIVVLAAGTVVRFVIFMPTDRHATDVSNFPVTLIADDPTAEHRVVSITAVINLAPSATYTYWLVLKVHDPRSPTSNQYYARARLQSTPQRTHVVLRFPPDSDVSSVRLARIYEVPAAIDKRFEATVKRPFSRQAPDGSPPCVSCISSNEIEVRFVP